MYCSIAYMGLMAQDSNRLDQAGKQVAYITNEWSDDPAIIQTQALCYIGLQLKRIADSLEEESES